MPLGRDGCQIVVAAGQDRAAFRPAQGDGDGFGILDGDDRPARGEGLPDAGTFVFLGVGGVQFLHHHVLIVDIGGGQAPADLFRPPDDDRGHAGNGAADHTPRRQFQPRQIPDRGGGKAQMRVVGQQRAARRRPVRHRGPGVGRAGEGQVLERRQRVVGQPDGHLSGPDAGHDVAITGQGGDAGAGVVGQDVAQAFGRQQHRGAGAQHLGLHHRGQLQRHQLDDGNRIGGLPGCDLVREQKEFGRAAPPRAGVDLPDPGVHTTRIGVQRLFGGIVLHRNR